MPASRSGSARRSRHPKVAQNNDTNKIEDEKTTRKPSITMLVADTFLDIPYPYHKWQDVESIKSSKRSIFKRSSLFRCSSRSSTSSRTSSGCSWSKDCHLGCTRGSRRRLRREKESELETTHTKEEKLDRQKKARMELYQEWQEAQNKADRKQASRSKRPITAAQKIGGRITQKPAKQLRSKKQLCNASEGDGSDQYDADTSEIEETESEDAESGAESGSRTEKVRIANQVSIRKNPSIKQTQTKRTAVVKPKSQKIVQESSSSLESERGSAESESEFESPPPSKTKIIQKTRTRTAQKNPSRKKLAAKPDGAKVFPRRKNTDSESEGGAPVKPPTKKTKAPVKSKMSNNNIIPDGLATVSGSGSGSGPDSTDEDDQGGVFLRGKGQYSIGIPAAGPPMGIFPPRPPLFGFTPYSAQAMPEQFAPKLPTGNWAWVTQSNGSGCYAWCPGPRVSSAQAAVFQSGGCSSQPAVAGYSPLSDPAKLEQDYQRKNIGQNSHGSRKAMSQPRKDVSDDFPLNVHNAKLVARTHRHECITCGKVQNIPATGGTPEVSPVSAYCRKCCGKKGYKVPASHANNDLVPVKSCLKKDESNKTASQDNRKASHTKVSWDSTVGELKKDPSKPYQAYVSSVSSSSTNDRMQSSGSGKDVFTSSRGGNGSILPVMNGSVAPVSPTKSGKKSTTSKTRVPKSTTKKAGKPAERTTTTRQVPNEKAPTRPGFTSEGTVAVPGQTKEPSSTTSRSSSGRSASNRYGPSMPDDTLLSKDDILQPRRKKMEWACDGIGDYDPIFDARYDPITGIYDIGYKGEMSEYDLDGGDSSASWEAQGGHGTTYGGWTAPQGYPPDEYESAAFEYNWDPPMGNYMSANFASSDNAYSTSPGYTENDNDSPNPAFRDSGVSFSNKEDAANRSGRTSFFRPMRPGAWSSGKGSTSNHEQQKCKTPSPDAVPGKSNLRGPAGSSEKKNVHWPSGIKSPAPGTPKFPQPVSCFDNLSMPDTPRHEAGRSFFRPYNCDHRHNFGHIDLDFDTTDFATGGAGEAHSPAAVSNLSYATHIGRNGSWDSNPDGSKWRAKGRSPWREHGFGDLISSIISVEPVGEYELASGDYDFYVEECSSADEYGSNSFRHHGLW